MFRKVRLLIGREIVWLGIGAIASLSLGAAALAQSFPQPSLEPPTPPPTSPSILPSPEIPTSPTVPAPVSVPTPQAIYPVCQPPNPGEYLLLVVSKTPEAQGKVRQSLPMSAKAIVCSYLDDVVTRVSGFTTIDAANAWVKYLNESAGLSAFVARPSTSAPVATASPAVATMTPPPSTPTSTKPTPIKSPTPSAAVSTKPATGITFNPRLLGTGYAVLVNYFSKPETATKVHQVMGRDVGLVSYGQRPYLLAVYTTDHAAANATLQKLSDRGFWAMVVDSRRVTLLKQTVNTKTAGNPK